VNDDMAIGILGSDDKGGGPPPTVERTAKKSEGNREEKGR
jgi:hypothetical protein